MNFNEQEAASAAKLCAACDHEVSTFGTCVYCGALHCDDGSWEPPLRRTRLFDPASRVTTTVLDGIRSRTTDARFQAMQEFARKLARFLTENDCEDDVTILLGWSIGIMVRSGWSEAEIERAIDAARSGALSIQQRLDQQSS